MSGIGVFQTESRHISRVLQGTTAWKSKVHIYIQVSGTHLGHQLTILETMFQFMVYVEEF